MNIDFHPVLIKLPKFIQSIHWRISEIHKYLEQKDVQTESIRNILEQNKLNDALFSLFLEKRLQCLKKLKRNNFITNIFFLTSGGLSRRLVSKFNNNIEKFAYGLLKFDYNTYNYELLQSIFEKNNQFVFREIVLPIAVNPLDKAPFFSEFDDILLPYFLENESIIIDDSFYNEGPYEINNVCLKRGDVVIDCGANMGLFSAIASVKGCKVYAFEPMKYTINNYLNKTAAWNKDIIICAYALSNRKQTLTFKTAKYNNTAAKGQGHFGNSEIVKNEISQQVQAITLDEFVTENKLDKVDFIKADIEGDERNMLIGARNVIRKFSPKISICTYHLPDDSKVLREILLDIQPKYKIQEKFKKMYAYVP